MENSVTSSKEIMSTSKKKQRKFDPQEISWNFVYSLNSDALVPQMSIDHAMLEVDRNNELVFYNTLASDHPDYDISSNAPGKEYSNKVQGLTAGWYKNVNHIEELFDIYKTQQRNNWEGTDSLYDA